MDLTTAVVLLFVLPLAGAAYLALGKRCQFICNGALAFVLAAVSAVTAVVLLFQYGSGGLLAGWLDWVPDLNLGFSLQFDALSLLTLAVITVLTALGVLYAISYFRGCGRDTGSFYAWMLLFMVGMTGVALSADMIQFYVFWEFMLIPSTALIAMWGERENRTAVALKYFVFTHVGAVFLLVGILWLYGATGTTDLFAVRELVLGLDQGVLLTMAVLFIVGFAVKLAIFPLHTWLPDAYATAPLPVAIVMAGAMMSAGIYGMMRFVFTLFPAAVVSQLVLPLMIVALVTLFYGAGMAMVQTEMRRILAYSSMSQMGYVLFGAATVAGLGVAGSVMHIMNHGLAKALLFMAIGAVVHRTGKETVTEVGGLARRMPWTALACAVGALSLCGAPPLGGFHSEWMIFAGGFASGYTWLSLLAIVGGVLTAGYALWLVARVFFGNLSEELSGVREAGCGIALPMLLVAVLILVVGVYPAPFVTWVREAVSFLAMTI